MGAFLLTTYLAVTLTVSAQLLSVSNIVSFDIYKQGFTVMLHYVGVDMTWMGYFYSMLICPGVIPLVLSITWKRQTTLAAFVSPVVGIITGIATWLGTAYRFYGEVTIFSTGQQLPCLYGGLVTLILPGIVGIIVSLTIKPYAFDWEKFKVANIIVTEEEINNNDITEGNSIDGEKKSNGEDGHSYLKSRTSSQSSIQDETSKRYRKLDLYVKISYAAAIFLLLLIWVVWPLPLYRDWIWSRAFFKSWTTVSLFWIYLALIIIGLYPLYDVRHSLKKVAVGVYKGYIQKHH